MPPESTSPGTVEDGRAARRLRNRQAVLDATYSLVEGGNSHPTFEQIAEASGVSLRSLYRYFASHDDLMRAAMLQRTERFEKLFRMTGLGEGDLQSRISALVDQRLALWDAVGAAVPVMRRLAPSPALLHEQMERRRAGLRRQMEIQFRPELDAMDEDRRFAVLSAADLLCQFEGIDYLRRSRRLSTARTRQVLTHSVAMLFGCDDVPAAGVRPSAGRRAPRR